MTSCPTKCDDLGDPYAIAQDPAMVEPEVAWSMASRHVSGTANLNYFRALMGWRPPRIPVTPGTLPGVMAKR